MNWWSRGFGPVWQGPRYGLGHQANQLHEALFARLPGLAVQVKLSEGLNRPCAYLRVSPPPAEKRLGYPRHV